MAHQPEDDLPDSENEDGNLPLDETLHSDAMAHQPEDDLPDPESEEGILPLNETLHSDDLNKDEKGVLQEQKEHQNDEDLVAPAGVPVAPEKKKAGFTSFGYSGMVFVMMAIVLGIIFIAQNKADLQGTDGRGISVSITNKTAKITSKKTIEGLAFVYCTEHVKNFFPEGGFAAANDVKAVEAASGVWKNKSFSVKFDGKLDKTEACWINPLSAPNTSPEKTDITTFSKSAEKTLKKLKLPEVLPVAPPPTGPTG